MMSMLRKDFEVEFKTMAEIIEDFMESNLTEIENTEIVMKSIENMEISEMEEIINLFSDEGKIMIGIPTDIKFKFK